MLVSRKPNKSLRLAKNSKIIRAIIQAIQEKKGEKIISLDLRKIPEAVADFFIVCEASSTTQIRAIADFIETDVKEKCSEGPYMHEGRQNMQWVIIDYINVVVHIMLPESRRFYKLEELWSDAVVEEHLG